MFLARIAFCCCLFSQTPLQAHEFWFAPITSPSSVGDVVTLRLDVGEFFTGEPAGFSIRTSRALRHVTAQGQEDLRPFLPPVVREAEVEVALDEAGTHLLAYDSAPLTITLPADTFHAYLHDEGLDFIKVQRQKAGTDTQPGRERYLRHIKTLVEVGPKAAPGQAPDMTYATRLGQRLEILPLQNPLKLSLADTLSLHIVFDNQPLAGALVKAWHKHDGQLVLIRATTSAQGLVEFNLPYEGDWMISVVHMIPAVDVEGVDWDSFWGNLSFHLTPRPH